MKYESNIVNVVTLIESKLKGVAEMRQLQGEVAALLLAANQNRVHTDGKNTNEEEIGQYSTATTLIGAKSFRKKSSVNATFGKTKNKQYRWVTVNGHRLAVLDGGYKKIRDIDGDFTGHVILKRTGKMYKDLHMEEKQGEWVIGFPANYSSRLTYRDMIAGFEKKYRGVRIWGVSPSEEKKVQELIQRHVNQKING